MKLSILNLIYLLFFIVFILAIKSCENSSFVDNRDGEVYTFKKMKDGRNWMTENLNFTMDNASCFNNVDSLCIAYGRLYNWFDAQKACPQGWHLPSLQEWEELALAYGGYFDWGNSIDIHNPIKAADAFRIGGSSGFNAQFAGNWSRNEGFYAFGKRSDFWTSTGYSLPEHAYYFYIYNEYNKLTKAYYKKEMKQYCRCIQDFKK